MTGRIATILLTVVPLISIGTRLKADTIQLINGDSLRGKVISLDEKQLVFRSETFGELKIGRAKIDLIALGDKGLPKTGQVAAPAASTGVGSSLGQIAPLLQSPAAQQQLGPLVEQLLGAGGVGDLQRNIDTARRGLQDLEKDFGEGPESKALDGYINLFNLFNQLAPATTAPGQQKPPRAPRPSPPPNKPPEPAKKR